ncbi:MAG: 3-hydroxyacyl-CoA dehydrogenase family protein [Bacteroidales bacterium]|nr:3-hydroxyacyl-CoA dehydrogenase family protein [Bacteroidales bacterium]MCF8457414.1 3-hydroxyacyl-CoA dehydrogenase family protein [Bacteroidales bacterium]
MAEYKEPIENYSLGKSTPQKGSLSKVGVIGCGTMGQEISLHISQCGLEVIFIDLSDEIIKSVFESFDQSLDEVINHWGLTQSEKRAILQRIKGSTDYNDLKDCELVIETIHSRKSGTSKEIRKEVFKNIEAVVSPTAVITSNVATIMISELASVLKHPERAVGTHFILPVSKVKIIEVARGSQSNEESYELVKKFARMIQKKVITVNESPGSVHTRMVAPMINEACEILMEGVASVRDIDETMKQATGFQFGPFEMADRIGLDKLLKWMDNLYSEFGESKYKASPVIKRLVRVNHIGRMVGVGFYKYVNGVATEETVTCAEIR